MSIWNSLVNRLSAEPLARFLGLMLIAWQPFWSGARLPTGLLLILGLWLLWHKRIDFSATPARRLGVVFLLLGIPVLLSVPNSFEPVRSLLILLVLGIFYLIGLALLQGLRRDTGRAWLQHWLLILIAAWSLDGYLQLFFGRDLLGHAIDDGRIVGPFVGNLHLGLFIAVLLPVAAWGLAKTRPLLLLGLIAFAGFIVAMSGSRSSILLLLLAVATLLIHLNQRQRLLALLAVLSISTSMAYLSPAISQRIQAVVQTPPDASLYDRLNIALSHRLTIWHNAAAMIADRPLTGVGASAFSEAYKHYAPPDDMFLTQQKVYHAEQMYVSVTAESGIPGLAGLLAAVALCLRWFHRAAPERRRQAAPFAAALAIIAFPLQSQPVLYTIWWFPVVLLLLCGLLAALGEPSKDNPTASQS